MKKNIFIFLITVVFVFGVIAQSITINRDKTPLKSGPGAFYDNLVFLQINTVVDNLGPATEDDGWLKISFKGQVDNKKTELVGYLSRLSISSKKMSDDPFSSLRMDDNKGGNARNQIAPGAYTAAIKGFLQNYSKNNNLKSYVYEDIYAYTSFTYKDYLQYKSKIGLSYFPKSGELIGLDSTHITDEMEALSAAVVYSTASKYELIKTSDSVRLNIIANVLSRQTIDYDKQYFVWVVSHKEPFAFSGPGGAIFISDGMLRLLDNDKEIIAVIAHEVGHISMRHGVRDLALEQARKNMKSAYDELDEILDSKYAAISSDLESTINDALEATSLVRDDKQEFEADDVAVELLRRYRIDKKFLSSALNKTYNNLSTAEMKEYRNQTQRRLKRIK